MKKALIFLILTLTNSVFSVPRTFKCVAESPGKTVANFNITVDVETKTVSGIISLIDVGNNLKIGEAQGLKGHPASVMGYRNATYVTISYPGLYALYFNLFRNRYATVLVDGEDGKESTSFQCE